MNGPRLSICIATYMRSAFIGETLRSIVPQLDARSEVVIVDGASTDDTEAVVQAFTTSRPNVRYFKQSVNSGVDGDYDNAMSYARGDYCWLMTDDDLIDDGAVNTILGYLASDPDLIVVNSRVTTADLEKELVACSLPRQGRTEFHGGEITELFKVAGAYLSFIGCVVVKRTIWLSRTRDIYVGSLFIHVGVLFQLPSITSAMIAREPLMTIRYGNAMWTARGFEIWLFKWPALIWSFSHLPEATRLAICPREAHRSFRRLVWYRALGGYSREEFRLFLRDRLRGRARFAALMVAFVPKRLANAMSAIYVWLRPPTSGPLALYELSLSNHAPALTKYLARWD